MVKLHHFVGIAINYLNSGNIWIGQPTYVRKVLKKFKMDNSKPVGTPVEIGKKIVKAKDRDNLVDQEVYQSAIGSLFYLSTSSSGIDMVTATSNGYEQKLCGFNDNF